MSHVIRHSLSVLFAMAYFFHAMETKANELQMLPPTQPASASICAGGSQILVYTADITKGHSAINCIPVTVDSSGKVTINGGTVLDTSSVKTSTLTSTTDNTTTANATTVNATNVNATNSVTAATLNSTTTNSTTDNTTALNSTTVKIGTVTLTKDSATAVVNLQGAKCSGSQALTQDTNGNINCIAVTDIVGVGQTTVPTCTSTQQLYFNGTSFLCQAIPFPAPPPGLPACGPNKLLGYDPSGNVACLDTPPNKPNIGTPLYAIITQGWSGNWTAYNAALYQELYNNYVTNQTYGGDYSLEMTQVNGWYSTCSISDTGQLPAAITGNSITYEYCGRFMCAHENGVWPFMTRLQDECPEGGDIGCNGGHFYSSWDCLNLGKN